METNVLKHVSYSLVSTMLILVPIHVLRNSILQNLMKDNVQTLTHVNQ